MAQTVKSRPAVWETGVQSLGQEDPLEKEMATHFTLCDDGFKEIELSLIITAGSTPLNQLFARI